MASNGKLRFEGIYTKLDVVNDVKNLSNSYALLLIPEELILSSTPKRA